MDISALCTHERLKTRMNVNVVSVTSCGYLHAHIFNTVFHDEKHCVFKYVDLKCLI